MNTNFLELAGPLHHIHHHFLCSRFCLFFYLVHGAHYKSRWGECGYNKLLIVIAKIRNKHVIYNETRTVMTKKTLSFLVMTVIHPKQYVFLCSHAKTS